MCSLCIVPQLPSLKSIGMCGHALAPFQCQKWHKSRANGEISSAQSWDPDAKLRPWQDHATWTQQDSYSQSSSLHHTNNTMNLENTCSQEKNTVTHLWQKKECLEKKCVWEKKTWQPRSEQRSGARVRLIWLCLFLLSREQRGRQQTVQRLNTLTFSWLNNNIRR